MTDVYSYSVDLSDVPTGFAIHKGVNIFNKGDSPCKYSVSIQKDLIQGLDVADQNNIITISENLFDPSVGIDKIDLNLNPNSSRKFYILHRPLVGDSVAAGQETASITIESTAYNGDNDSDITINVTANRVTDAPSPPKPTAFYGVSNWNHSDGYSVTFNWDYRNEVAFVTGFALEVAEDSSFSTLVNNEVKYLPIEVNDSFILPTYGNYAGLSGENFSVKIENLDSNKSYYARIRSINHEGEVDSNGYVYASFFKNTIPDLSDSQINSTIASPGEQLSFPKEVLGPINVFVRQYNAPIDVLKLLYDNNVDFFGQGSYNFSNYTGAIINFMPALGDSVGGIRGSRGDDGYLPPLYCRKPSEYSFAVNENDENSFKLQLNFNNVNLYGLGGDNSFSNGTPTDGSPVFDFDNLDYLDGGVNKVFDYVLVKDIYSKFKAGPGGGATYFISDDSLDGLNNHRVFSNTPKYLDFYNLVDLDVSKIADKINQDIDTNE